VRTSGSAGAPEHLDHGRVVAAAEPGEVEAYDRAAPYWHCYLGLERYWRKRAEAVAD